MARKSKPSETSPTADDEAVQGPTAQEPRPDTAEIEAATPEEEAAAAVVDGEKEEVAREEETPEPQPDSFAETPETVAEEAADEDRDAAGDAEPAEEPSAEEPPATAGERTAGARQSWGAVMLLLGGVAAAAIGIGAARFVLPQDWLSDTGALEQRIGVRLESQAEAIDGLAARLEGLPPPPDLSGLQGGQAALSGRLDAIETQMGDIETRLTAVEKRPVAEGASDAAIAAYERELQALRESVAAQRAEVETMAEEARATEERAVQAARIANQRAALTRVETALDTGRAFAAALADLQAAGVTAPPGLARAADRGVATLAELQESFPDAARAALAASRQAAAEAGEGTGWQSFLKTQLGVRSLAPREGNDPDAVLSRIEAALREGRLRDALAGIEALPEDGRAALADWAGRVAQRREALDALRAVRETVN